MLFDLPFEGGGRNFGFLGGRGRGVVGRGDIRSSLPSLH